MAEQRKPQTPPDPAHQPGTSKGEEKVREEGEQAGRQSTGTTGKVKRPAGKSTPEDSTGVNPSGPVDSQSPHLPTP